MNVIGVLGQAGSGKNTVGDMIVAAVGGKCIALADPMKQFGADVFGFKHAWLWGESELRNQKRCEYADPYVQEEVRDTLHAKLVFDWLRDLMPDASSFEIDSAWEKLIDWSEDLLEGARTDGYLTPRKMLQTLGTEWGRDFSTDMWIDYALRRAHSMLVDGKARVVCITDVRFINEAKKLFLSRAHVWRVTRPGFDGALANNAGVANHRSERDQASDEIATWITREIINNGTLEALNQTVTGLLRKNGIGACLSSRPEIEPSSSIAGVAT